MARPVLRCWGYLLALLLLALLGGCAAPAETTLEPTAGNLVWPAAPDEPRIVFVRTIAEPKDLGFTKSFFRRAIEFIFGAEQERLVRPMAVLEVGQVLYVADPGAKGVHRFDRRDSTYQLIHLKGEQGLPSPIGLARGESDSVFVTDSALGSVFVIKPGAEFAEPLALAQAVKQPTGIAFDGASGKLYVVDTIAHNIKVYSAQGAYLSTIGQRGEGDAEFNFPTMLWLDKGHLLVTDSLNFRTQILDTQGRFIGKFGRMGDSNGDAPRQKGVATDSFGHIYLADSLLSGVQVFNESGQLLLSMGGLGQKPGEFWLPTGIFIGSDDMIYVADSYNRRVQVFRYVGGPT
jgi:DNA-binding beta-propeller fold protein YncE